MVLPFVLITQSLRSRSPSGTCRYGGCAAVFCYYGCESNNNAEGGEAGACLHAGKGSLSQIWADVVRHACVCEVWGAWLVCSLAGGAGGGRCCNAFYPAYLPSHPMILLQSTIIITGKSKLIALCHPMELPSTL